MDIYFGILIASFAPSLSLTEILPFPLNVLLGPIMIGFGLAFFILSKKFLIKPRIGVVKFGRKRKVRKRRTMVVLSINIVILLILFLLRVSDIGGSFSLPFLIEGYLFLTVPLCIVAYFLQFTRLYIYGFLLGSGFFLADISSIIVPIPYNFLFTYLLLGGIIVIIGVTYLIRFLRKYPLPREET
ncbi:MAG: hypothetical protein KGD68_01890 [Candidatus Lokiarchaeota archaeon]|nr:hypothetical protein [Candidatus Lokiarchaeota archaeon]